MPFGTGGPLLPQETCGLPSRRESSLKPRAPRPFAPPADLPEERRPRWPPARPHTRSPTPGLSSGRPSSDACPRPWGAQRPPPRPGFAAAPCVITAALVTIPATRRQLERPRTGDRLRQCEGPHVVRAVQPRSTRRHAGPRGRRAQRRQPGARGHSVRQASSDADAGRQVSVGGEQTRCFRPGRKTLLGEAFLGGPAARPKRRPGRVRPRPAALPAARPPACLRPGPARPSLLHPQPGPPQAPFISTDPRCGEQSDLGNDPQIQSQ